MKLNKQMVQSHGNGISCMNDDLLASHNIMLRNAYHIVKCKINESLAREQSH